MAAAMIVIAACSGPGRSTAEQSAADRLFRDKCQTCHRLPAANDMAAREWPSFLSAHARRAALDDAEIILLSEFLAAQEGSAAADSSSAR